MDNKNLDIWNKVCNTDRNHVKQNQASGWTQMAINSYEYIRNITEQFGPFGKGWGIDSTSFKLTRVYQEVPESKMTKQDYKTKQDVVISVPAHTRCDLQVECVVFWYIDGVKCTTPSSTTFPETAWDVKRNTLVTDYYASEKAVTSIIKKTFSFLGFHADIFTGQFGFDDDKSTSVITSAYSSSSANNDKVVLLSGSPEEIYDYLKSIPSDGNLASSAQQNFVSGNLGKIIPDKNELNAFLSKIFDKKLLELTQAQAQAIITLVGATKETGYKPTEHGINSVKALQNM